VSIDALKRFRYPYTAGLPWGLVEEVIEEDGLTYSYMTNGEAVMSVELYERLLAEIKESE
jgi:hypothetical protein